MTLEEKNFLCHYDLTSEFLKNIPLKIIELQPLNYGFKLITPEKKYFLKKLRYSLLEWEYINSYKNYIKKEIDIKVPEIFQVKNKKHDKLLCWNNDWYEIIEWIDEEEIDLKNIEHVIKGIKVLAKIHRVSRNYVNDYELVSRNETEQLPYRLITMYRELSKYEYDVESKKEKTDFDKLFYSEVRKINSQIENIYCNLIKSNYYNMAENYINNKNLIINNYTKNNIKISKEGTFYLTNFDEISYDIYLKDIANFIKKCAKQENTDVTNIKNIIINNYAFENGLSKQEKEWIDFLLRIPNGFYKLCKQYYEQNNTNRSDTYLEKLKKEIEFYQQASL